MRTRSLSYVWPKTACNPCQHPIWSNRQPLRLRLLQQTSSPRSLAPTCQGSSPPRNSSSAPHQRTLRLQFTRAPLSTRPLPPWQHHHISCHHNLHPTRCLNIRRQAPHTANKPHPQGTDPSLVKRLCQMPDKTMMTITRTAATLHQHQPWLVDRQDVSRHRHHNHLRTHPYQRPYRRIPLLLLQ